MFRNILFFWTSLFAVNEFYIHGLKKFCKKNIEIVDAVFETHLNLIAAHGVDMKKAIDYYHGMIEGKAPGTDIQTVSENKNEAFGGFGKI